ncbi:transcriptional regulator, AraC family [Agrococcus baldri]|uniref:Transcriptional regulator, AraC family n=1 Tax=Agrococcus baldri TaxID=153730 RepID=A0AA94L016_9MICO|nr:AraC family transcriptional regulator [Agrococcus baldri]SFS14681.1 transcriptional regulator, AraC family [Agrococcus baldri]
MTYEEIGPPARLTGIATRLWHLEAVPLRRYEKILPLPNVHLIVNLSRPYRLFDRAGRASEVVDAFVSGLQRECLMIESPTRIHHVGVELTPAGLHTLAPHQAAASAGTVQDARRLLAGIGALVAQLHAASAPDVSLRILVDFLSGAVVQPPDRLVADALQLIGAEFDRTVESVSIELGVSQRTLMTRFRTVTGTTPKQHAQVLRFHRFVDAVHAAGGRPDWAALAVTSGYYDQPHVIRAFRRFSGWTPGEYYRLAAEHGPDAAHFVPLDQLPRAAQASA